MWKLKVWTGIQSHDWVAALQKLSWLGRVLGQIILQLKKENQEGPTLAKQQLIKFSKTPKTCILQNYQDDHLAFFQLLSQFNSLK